MSKTSILVIGACGFIGRHALRMLRDSGIRADGTCHHPDSHATYHLDFSKPDMSDIEKRYTHALILGGITKVASCEQDPEGTREVNVTGTLDLVRQLHEREIIPVFFSSDYVFSGDSGPYSETSHANPITEYGRQKAEVEAALDEITGGQHLVIRPGKVFSIEKGDGTFIDEMAGILHGGGTVKAAHDQMINPLLIDDLVRAVQLLIEKEATGLFQVCDGKTLSRYEIAVQLKEEMGDAAAGRIERISIDDLGIRRPKDTSMDNTKAREAGCTFTPLYDSIKLIAENYR